MRGLSVFLLLVFLVKSINSAVPEDPSFVGQLCSSWVKLLGFLKHVLDDCKHITLERKDYSSNELYLELMQQCLKKKSLISLDRILELDVIPLNQRMELIRYSNNTARVSNETGRGIEQEDEWRFQVLDRVGELFRTHALRFTLEDDTGDNTVMEKETATGRVRHRHFYRHIFPMMVIAFMMMITILVPLGFQFMAVIGGKAILLSKMALMLSSAQAMKRVTSAWFDVYHAPTAPISYGNIHRSYHLSGHHHDQDHYHDGHRHKQQQWDLGHAHRQQQQYQHNDLGQQFLYASPSTEQQVYQTLPAGYTYATNPQNQLLGWS